MSQAKSAEKVVQAIRRTLAQRLMARRAAAAIKLGGNFAPNYAALSL